MNAISSWPNNEMNESACSRKRSKLSTKTEHFLTGKLKWTLVNKKERQKGRASEQAREKKKNSVIFVLATTANSIITTFSVYIYTLQHDIASDKHQCFCVSMPRHFIHIGLANLIDTTSTPYTEKSNIDLIQTKELVTVVIQRWKR